jgi:energy-coupling factor transport system permease protein
MTISRNTVLQRLDPRTKFLALVLLAFQILFFERGEALGAAAAIVLIATLLSPIRLPFLFGKMLRVGWFVAFIVLLNAFTSSGSVFIAVWGLYGTIEGLHEGLLLSARIVVLLFLSLLFAHSTHIADLMDALESVPAAVRRRLGRAIVAAGLTLNFVPQLIQSAQTIKRAQLARGADVDTGLFPQIRFAFSAALPLFVAAFRSSHHLAEAMEARAYDPSVERTAFRILKMHARDWAVLLVLFGQFAGLLLFMP